MKGPQLKRVGIVIAVCALIGALAGIAGSAAAPSSKSTQASKAAKAKAKAMKRAFRHGPGFRMGFFGFGGPGMGGVHATAVVPSQDGKSFITITSDAGTLNSVDGTTVHLKEGTAQATYKGDVAIDVGSNAKVIRNGQDAKLSDLTAGDHVRVITGAPKGNIVIAADDAFIQKERQEHGFRHHGMGPGGPPPMGPGGTNG